MSNPEQALRGWDSSFRDFTGTGKSRILDALRASYPRSGSSEVRSWQINVPLLQREVRESLDADESAEGCTAVLEYQLPMEFRRPDAVLLIRGAVVVLELKGEAEATDASIDQAHAYARDLRNYHRSCHHRNVRPVVVPTRMTGWARVERGVHVCPPARLDGLIQEFDGQEGDAIPPDDFLAAEAYKPLPSLVVAARKLFFERKPPQLWRSIANTDDAVDTALRIIREARETRTRRLILLTGVPGAGKTLVGLRVAHAPELHPEGESADTPAAVFLSGNGPLVDVLQHVLESKAFVRPVKAYVNRYKRRPALVPTENVLIFDEAQRAHDEARVREVHRDPGARSEPELFVDFAERRQDWAVVVGLIGSGQEIHTGEEGGMGLWMRALKAGAGPASWQIHGPPELAKSFSGLRFRVEPTLSLEQTVRSHLATELHGFVAHLLRPKPASPEVMRPVAERLEREGHDLRITRCLDTAKAYLWERYGSDPRARYGLVASSRDRDLEPGFGVPNGFQATKRVRYGPWYNEDEHDPGGKSCRRLVDCVTEFGAQGLELDAVLLAWGTDFILSGGAWSNERARNYRPPAPKDPWQLRANAYRVLLTRGRDAHVVFLPEMDCLDETCRYLVACGFRELKSG